MYEGVQSTWLGEWNGSRNKLFLVLKQWGAERRHDKDINIIGKQCNSRTNIDGCSPIPQYTF